MATSRRYGTSISTPTVRCLRRLRIMRRNAYGLALLDAGGTQTAFVSTGSFAPTRLAISEDHSIWVLGTEYRKHLDYMVLRKYHAGRTVGRFFPAAINQAWNPGAQGALLYAPPRIASR